MYIFGLIINYLLLLLVDVVGSYLLRTVAKPELNIDVVIEMPALLFQVTWGMVVERRIRVELHWHEFQECVGMLLIALVFSPCN